MALIDENLNTGLGKAEKEYSITHRLMPTLETSYEQAFNNKSLKTEQLTCKHTGITIGLEVPHIESLDLYYTSPFAEFKNCLKIASLSSKDLKSLPTGILAGVFLTLSKHFNLISSKDDILLTNALLQSAGTDLLIQGIILTRDLTPSDAVILNDINLDYETYKDGTKDFKVPFKSHLHTWRTNLSASSVTAKIEASEGIIRIKGSYTPLTVTKSISSNTKSDYERDWEHDFSHLRAEAKEAFRVLSIPLISLNYKKLVEFLKPLLIGRNILTLNEENREKLTSRLGQAQMELPVEMQLMVNSVFKFIDFSNNKEFKVNVTDLLERASDSMEKPRRLSLKELIALKNKESIEVNND